MRRAGTRDPVKRGYDRVPPEFGLGFATLVVTAVAAVLIFGNSAATLGIGVGVVAGLCVGVLVARTR